MPQINKIRIVNLKYNDGNRFIPDELFDLSSDKGEALNSLFNLTNGGGKTVLVQLMMQPVHPRAMAGGRHIEEYFAYPGAHSYIVIEWNTDGSNEKLLTGIAIAGRNSDDSQRGNSIRYYTFKTVYEYNSPYAIAALELSKNENGRYVPASFDYVRDKAKASRGMLEYYSSDDTANWNKELAEYGIYRAEWETVIEALNKDEGGLNQYFDGAKTSDKLIEKFFIPAIENKMNSVAVGGKDSSLETMLLNYAKKISEKEAVIQERDNNRRLLNELTHLGTMSDELYTAGEKFTSVISEACGFRASLGKAIKSIEEEAAETDKAVRQIEEKLARIEHEEKSGEYYESLDEYETARIALANVQESLNRTEEETQKKKHAEDVLMAARLHWQIKKADIDISTYKRLISEKENNSEDAEQILKLKYSIFIKAEKEQKALVNNIEDNGNRIQKKADELQDAETDLQKAENAMDMAKNQYRDISAKLDALKQITDDRRLLLGVEIARRLDGFYEGKEIEGELQRKSDYRTTLVSAITQMQNDRAALTDRKVIIPEELAELKFEHERLCEKKDKTEEELSEYNKTIEVLEKICNKYSLDGSAIFSGRLVEAVREKKELTEAGLRKHEQDKRSLEKRRKAADEGHVHIIPEIMDYIASTGSIFRTGEEYLTGLIERGMITREKAENILEKYPEFAFSLLFDNEEEMQKFLTAGNAEWFQAAVPIFTMDQVNTLLDETAGRNRFLAVYDKTYFADKAGYCRLLTAEIDAREEQISRIKERLQKCEREAKLVEGFDYPPGWSDAQEQIMKELEKKISASVAKKRELEKERDETNEKLSALEKEISNKNIKLTETDKWLSLFEEFKTMLGREKELFDTQQSVYSALNEAEIECRKYSDIVSELKNEMRGFENARIQLNQKLSRVKEILDNVDNATEADTVDGALEDLYSSYQTLCRSMSSSLEKLEISLAEAQKNKAAYTDEINGYDCDIAEYKDVYFSSELLNTAKQELKKSEEKLEKIRAEFVECCKVQASSEQRFGAARKTLESYGGEALPKNEIGGNFKERIHTAKTEKNQLTEKNRKLERERKSLERTFDKSGNAMAELSSVEKVTTVALSDNPEEQWKEVHGRINGMKNDFSMRREKLIRKIDNTVAAFTESTLAEIVNKLTNIGSMLYDSGMKGDRLYTVSESIGMMIASIEKINSKIETDLREIENDFNDIVNQCMNQGKRMYLDLRSIAASSKARIFAGKPQTQMVKMNLPDEKEISEEASRIAIKGEIEQGANEIKELMRVGADDKQIRKRAGVIVSSERLLHRYIRQESIQVKVFKIDMNSANSVYKRWEDTLTQSSGAEKFVVFFSVVLTLMNYTRSAVGLVSKNSRSVLILDNPFGKITSAHLLRPMFDIAKHFNVQLICLSDINKSDVIGCFDCVIKMVIKKQSLSNFDIMTHEGNELIEHGYYKVMNGQIKLF